MLEDEEIKNLLHKAQAGDQIAKEYILENNINLVRSVVHRFTNRGYEWDDLFQLGCIGLVKAIERFDTKFNVKFSTYAVPMIIGEIRRFIRDDNPVKVSRPVKELAYKVHRTQERLQGILGRDPTISEVANDLCLVPQEVVAALEAIQVPTSLYASVFHDDGDPILLLDQIKYCEDEDNAYFDKLALKEILLRLPEKERIVIHLRFFADKTQAEVAEIIGLSQVQISRIEKYALKLMKEFI
ncbi:MAG: polymerase, sigma 28 subunit, SigF [Pelosinus sp.]|jgi:RNA polymerase sporulation-specific sigma factor|nr:polymerase, sigma 28 subunit, SigF [Pelosinus sp.]